MPISERKKNFCHEYVKDFSPVKALMRAGYAASTANKRSGWMMKDPDVIEYIKQITAKALETTGLTADKVLGEIQRLAFADHTQFYKWSDTKQKYVLKPIDELTSDQRAAVAEYKPGEYYKLYSKDSALDKLAKYFKLYSEIDATVTNFVLMPTVKYGGKEVVFEVGKPATKTPSQKKN